LSRYLPDAAATRHAGAALARVLGALDAPARAKAPAGALRGTFVTLAGELGAGKTTLVRGLLEALGVTGPVRSPTFTLLESYAAGPRQVDHLDWYRLSGAGDLEALDFRELLAAGHWVLVEWPERVPAVAAAADLAVRLRYEDSGRRLEVVPMTEPGRVVGAALEADKTLG
jgi:tRNA threonylcarbamoyladenosine biosynthesis protein TsaE